MKLIFDKDSNGTQELVDALGLIDARTDFSKWKPYIPLSIRRLTAIIGQEVYDKVLDSTNRQASIRMASSPACWEWCSSP